MSAWKRQRWRCSDCLPLLCRRIAIVLSISLGDIAFQSRYDDTRVFSLCSVSYLILGHHPLAVTFTRDMRILFMCRKQDGRTLGVKPKSGDVTSLHVFTIRCSSVKFFFSSLDNNKNRKRKHASRSFSSLFAVTLKVSLLLYVSGYIFWPLFWNFPFSMAEVCCLCTRSIW